MTEGVKSDKFDNLIDSALDLREIPFFVHLVHFNSTSHLPHIEVAR